MNQLIAKEQCQNIKNNVSGILVKHRITGECCQEVMEVVDNCEEPFMALHTAYRQRK